MTKEQWTKGMLRLMEEQKREMEKRDIVHLAPEKMPEFLKLREKYHALYIDLWNVYKMENKVK